MKHFLMVYQQPAFILHKRDFRNTSQILELFTLDYGRVSVIAKGAKRDKTKAMGDLQPFISLLVNFQGKAELKTLTSFEANGKQAKISGLSAYCSLYLNELLLYSMAKHDPHQKLFRAYKRILPLLAGQQDMSQLLRKFEYVLLRELGFEIDLKLDKFGQKIVPSKRYIFDQGFLPSENGISGSCLSSLKTKNNKTEGECAKHLRLLMQNLIANILHGHTLKSRAAMQDYLQISKNE